MRDWHSYANEAELAYLEKQDANNRMEAAKKFPAEEIARRRRKEARLKAIAAIMKTLAACPEAQSILVEAARGQSKC